MKEIFCNVCGEMNTFLLFKQRDLYIKKNDPTEFSLVQCKKCELVFINPQPTYQELSPFYQDGYFTSTELSDGPKSFLNSLKKFRREKLPEFKPRFYKWGLFSKREGNFLDVGCAVGAKSKGLIRDFPGWSFYGIEPDQNAVEIANKLEKFNVSKGSLLDVEYNNNFFDIIMFHHVLEHVPDPKKNIKESHRILKDGGYLIIVVPNYGSIFSKIFKKNWRHLDIPRHLFHFNRNTLKTLLGDNGFRVEKIEAETMDGSFLNSLVTSLNLNLNLDNNIFVAFIRFLFAPITRTLRIGGSLYILAKKV